MKENKLLKKLQNLMYKHKPDEYHSIKKSEIITRIEFVPKQSIQEYYNFKTQYFLSLTKNKTCDVKYLKNIAEEKKIYELAIELQLDSIEFHMMWYNCYNEKLDNKQTYSAKPLKEGRDNKDVLNLSKHPGDYTGNTIRYPKKNRKTAWKRFYKLFPKLDPKNKKDE